MLISAINGIQLYLRMGLKNIRAAKDQMGLSLIQFYNTD